MGPHCSRLLVTGLLLGVSGCIQTPNRRADGVVSSGIHQSAKFLTASEVHVEREVISSQPPEKNLDLEQPLPVEVLINRALAENRTVQAAFHNVKSLHYRIPQVTALDDPVLSNTVFPIPSAGPQYSLMGYNPYNVTVAQQFPWFGTLWLQGQVADGDVKVALAELATAQVDAISAVKRSYFTLYAAQKTAEILSENRAILEDFLAVAQERLSTGGSQQDVIRAETLISEIDRNLAENQVALANARAGLARQVHAHPQTEFQTLENLPVIRVPTEFNDLYEWAVEGRPELMGRMAAVQRDVTSVELAQQRYFPNVTLGLTYMDMTRTHAMSPTAQGMPNVGFVVGLNLPVRRSKYQAGVSEASERAMADSRLLEAQIDETMAEIQDSLVQVKTQEGVLGLLTDQVAPRTQEAFELARSDYAKANVDYGTILAALREKLQVSLQIALVEAELGRAHANLERAVGCELVTRGSVDTMIESSIQEDQLASSDHQVHRSSSVVQKTETRRSRPAPSLKSTPRSGSKTAQRTPNRPAFVLTFADWREVLPSE